MTQNYTRNKGKNPQKYGNKDVEIHSITFSKTSRSFRDSAYQSKAGQLQSSIRPMQNIKQEQYPREAYLDRSNPQQINKNNPKTMSAKPDSKVDSEVRGTEVAPNKQPKFESGVDDLSGVQQNNQPKMSNEEGRAKVDKDKKKKKGCFGCF